MVLIHLNSAKEVLDGPILSYEYKCSGIVLDRIKNTVRLFNKNNDKTYPFDKILNISYYIVDTPENNKSALKNLITIKQTAERKYITRHHYILHISVDDNELKHWKIRIPPDSEITPSISICEYWISIFNKYVL